MGQSELGATVDNQVGALRDLRDRPGSKIQSFPYEGEFQFQRLLEKLPAGAYTCDSEGLITFFNKHAVELWGRAPKLHDPVDRFCGSFKLFSVDGTPIAHDRCWMAMALKTDQEYNKREIIIERPDGQRLTALAHASPIHDESGELIGAVNVLVDITDRKRAEEALREVREYERRRISRDLHDSVLQNLAYAAQVLEVTKLSVEGTGLEEGIQEGINTMRHAAMELRGIVYDLHIGDEEDRPFPDLLESLVERNRSMARGYQIVLEVEKGFPEASFEEVGIELLRIIQEALTNARRHSQAKNVAVTLGAEEGHLVVEVADDGRGFEHGATPGVGLKSMRERAAALGGELEIESGPDGTKVRFRAPKSCLLRRAS